MPDDILMNVDVIANPHEAQEGAQRSAGGPPALLRICGQDVRAPVRAPAPFRGWHMRGYIPHLDAPNLAQTVTFRLYDSLPAHVIAQWKEEIGIKQAQKGASSFLRAKDYRRNADLLKRVSEHEDAGYGACYLRNNDVAVIVRDVLLFHDGKRYNLLEWCIMPNHVHVLIDLNEQFSLSSIVHSWKSYSAKKANAVLGRTGRFWSGDYFDRSIRNDEHLAAVRSYIRENPVKSGLVEKAEDWIWGSAGRSEDILPASS